MRPTLPTWRGRRLRSIEDLSTFPLFEGCPADEVASLASRLRRRDVAAGEPIMSEGEEGTFFVLVVDGCVEVTVAGGTKRLAEAGPGSVLGELAMLLDHHRTATVTASTDSTLMEGDAGAFSAMVDIPGVHDRLTAIVSVRLAEGVRPVPATLPDGMPVLIRPLVPSDREAYTDTVRHLSRESLRLRFFTGGVPSERTLEYLIDISYTDHFAWVAVDGRGDRRAMAVARYIRSHHDPTVADLAFGVGDDWQGRGIGTLLLGALGAAAPLAGIDTFTADVLAENVAMRKVFRKAGARFVMQEPGVIATSFPATAAAALLDDELRTELADAAHDVVTAAGLALATRPDRDADR